jgi:hypothetical protein
VAVAACRTSGAYADLFIAVANTRLCAAGNLRNVSTVAARAVQVPITITTGNFTDVAAGDVVGTAVPEVVALNATASTVSVYVALTQLQIGGSPFAAGTGASAISLADVNNDGKLDILVAGSGGVGVLETPTLARNSVTTTSAVSVTAGNFDGDGKRDLAICATSGEVSVVHGYNPGTAPDSIESGSCLLTGSYLTSGSLTNVGNPNGSFCNTDELAVIRNATSQACTLRFRCQQRVTAVSGSGCPGYTVTASTQGSPVVGNSNFQLTVNGAVPFSFAMALAQYNVPSETAPALVAFPPCFHIFNLGQAISEIPTITNAVGQGVNFLPIPNNPAFIGLELRNQWAVFDNVGPISGGITLSNAIVIRVGEY